jgi:WD40 repeat protein
MSREKTYSLTETLTELSQNRIQVLSLSQIKTINKAPKVLASCEGHAKSSDNNWRDAITCIAVFPNGKVVSGSNDKTLKVWDSITGTCLATLTGHMEVVLCMAVLSSGQVVSGAGTSTLKIWKPFLLPLAVDEQPKLFKAVDENPSLHTLDSSNFALSPAGIQSLTKAIAKHHTLRALHLNYCGLTDENTAHLFEVLPQKENGVQTEEVDWDHWEFKLSCSELGMTNQIGALLQDAGMNYWVQPMNSSVFSYRPTKTGDTEIKNSEVPSVECKIQ